MVSFIVKMLIFLQIAIALTKAISPMAMNPYYAQPKLKKIKPVFEQFLRRYFCELISKERNCSPALENSKLPNLRQQRNIYLKLIGR